MGREEREVSEWWNEEVGRAVAKKRRAFDEGFGDDRVTYDRYRAQRVVVKLAASCKKNAGLAMRRAIRQ